MKVCFIAAISLALVSYTTTPKAHDNFKRYDKWTLHNPPTVSTGANQLVVLPSHSTTLSSSYTVEGSVIATKWTKFKVPGQTAKKVVVLGSSTSLGTGTTATQFSYVGRLRDYYQAQGIVSSVLNLANTGSDLGAALPTGSAPVTGLSAPDPLRNVTAAISNNANVVIVNFPSNGYTNPAVTPHVVAVQHQIIYDALQAAGIQCYITTTQSRHDFSMPDRIKLQVIRDTLLLRFGSHCINFYDGLTNPGMTTQIAEYADGDGIHFNNLGHERFFQLVRAANIFEHTYTSPSSINTPHLGETNITGLTAGTHQFQVSITDADGLTASAVTEIVVTAGVLPLKLLSLSGNVQNGKAVLYWETLNEINSSHFEVELSHDATSFSLTGSIAALNNTSQSKYSFTTNHLHTGTTYYRLKMKDRDGTYRYSPIIKISGNLQALLKVTATPNPVLGDANLHLTIEEKGLYKIAVCDLSGKTLFIQEKYLLKGLTIFPIRVSNYPPGTYVVKLAGRATEATTKFTR